MFGADALIHLTRLLFERLDRKYVETLHEKYDAGELAAKYSYSSVRRIFTAVLQFFIFVGVNWELMSAAYRLFEQYARRDPDVQVVFQDSTVLLIGSFAVGLVAACGLLAVCELVRQRIKYRDRWHEYMAFKCMQFEFDVYRRVGQLFIFVGIPLLLLGMLCADTYTLATSREMVFSPFASFGESRYPFAQIRSLQQRTFMGRRKDKRELQTYHAIELDDGTKWESRSSRSSISHEDYQLGLRLVDYLSQQTGLPIVKAPMDP